MRLLLAHVCCTSGIRQFHRQSASFRFTVLWPVRFRHKAEQDHPMVAAMTACGAMLLGKTNMHELGVSPLGLNMHYGITRNPHNPGCFAGGSSSGSAAVVAAGLCPFAIGEKLQRTVPTISLSQAILSSSTRIIVDCELQHSMSGCMC